jgi:hypothetical protein
MVYEQAVRASWPGRFTLLFIMGEFQCAFKRDDHGEMGFVAFNGHELYLTPWPTGQGEYPSSVRLAINPIV